MGVPCNTKEVNVRTKLLRYRNFMEKRMKKIKNASRKGLHCPSFALSIIENNYVFYGVISILILMLIVLSILKHRKKMIK